MTKPLLKVDQLKVHYEIRGGVLFRKQATNYAVDGVSFEINQGETLGLVGESGCGKSSLAKALMLLEPTTAGYISFQDEDVNEFSKSRLRDFRKDMQIIFQDPLESLNSRHTVGEILAEPFIIHKIGTKQEHKQWVKELLIKVGLQEDCVNRYPHEFSGGQRQRIGIARAIALKPKLLVCDEPVSALDVSIQSQVLNLLMELQQEMNLAILFISHDLSVVKHISDKVSVMYLGKIIESATADNLYQQPFHPYTQALISAIPKPVPRKNIKSITLHGELPSSINPPSGCRFHTRCPKVQDLCRETEPILEERQGVSNLVACHYID